MKSQDPASVAEKIKSYVENEGQTFAGVKFTVAKLLFEAQPYRMSMNTVSNRAASAVLTELYGTKPLPFRNGGSIPFMSHLQQVLGVDTTMFAISYNDENVHAPDEYIHLSSLDQAEVAYVRLFKQIAMEHKADIKKSEL